eukprot:GFYU01075127.1.p1 GENE.GFYU01075127.1~~GFYU01075127.1.p1  ORF type:complete len:112 (-),score=10.66 GFYU01075127.1:13-348(-)
MGSVLYWIIPMHRLLAVAALSLVCSSAMGLSTLPLKRPSVNDCETKWFDQRLDHWGFASQATAAFPLTFKERYFVCYPAGVTASTAKNVFFYTGNEANVELYVNLTGLMWD